MINFGVALLFMHWSNNGNIYLYLQQHNWRLSHQEFCPFDKREFLIRDILGNHKYQE